MNTSVFLGTPEAALPALKVTNQLTDLRLVITKPDSASGRGRQTAMSEVGEAATGMGLKVAKPATKADLADVLPDSLDVAVVVAFGMIIPAKLLGVPGMGFVNLHFSHLPRWRGAAPVARAIQAGDRTTGVTLMALDEGMDTGPILARSPSVEIGHRTAGDVTEELAGLAASLLEANLGAYLSGLLTARPQPSGATLAPPVTKSEAAFDPQVGPTDAVRHIRAFSPSPGAWASWNGKRLRLLDAAEFHGEGADLNPGLLWADKARLLCGVSGGAIELVTVQPPGRTPMAGAAWARGRRSELGSLSLGRD